MPGEKEGEKDVRAISVINRFSNEEQAEILNSFTGEGNALPTEEGILMSPISIWGLDATADSFKTIWTKVEEIYQRKEREFKLLSFREAQEYLIHGEEIWKNKNKILQKMIEGVSQDIVDGKNISDLQAKWAIMLNYADLYLHQDFSSIQEGGEEKEIPDGLIFDYYQNLNFAPPIKNTSCGYLGELDNPLNPFNGNPLAIRTVRFGLPPVQGPKQENNVYGLDQKTEKQDYMNDKSLCTCGGKAAHFHCPGEKEIKVDGETKLEACNHRIIVGRGIKRCPGCGLNKIC